VTLIQASPGEPPLNFYINGNKVNAIPITYGDDLDYFRVFSGNRTANFYDLSMNTVLSAPLNVAPNTAYSVFLANVATKPEIVLLTDTLNKPSAGNASVRFVNLSPDAPAVDLVVQGGAIISSNKSFKGYSSFVSIPGKSDYTFEIRKSGTNTVLATLPNVGIASGYVYTIWFHGLASGTGADKLSAGLITNAYFF